LKAPKGYSEAVNRRWTDNTMAKRKEKRTQGQAKIYTEWLGVRVMGCNGSFNNISAIFSRQFYW